MLGSPPEMQEPPLPLPQDHPASPSLAPCLAVSPPGPSLKSAPTVFLGDSAFPHDDFPQFLILGSPVCLLAACPHRTARWLQGRVGCAPQLPGLSARQRGCLDVDCHGRESGPPAVWRDSGSGVSVRWRQSEALEGWWCERGASHTPAKRRVRAVGPASREQERISSRPPGAPLQLPLYLLEVIK